MADVNVDPSMMISNLELCEWGELGGQRLLAVQLWQAWSCAWRETWTGLGWGCTRERPYGDTLILHIS